MPSVTPLALLDYAVLGAVNAAGTAASVDSLAAMVAAPERGPGLYLSPESVCRIVTRLRARGLVEDCTDGGWRLTHRGRVLWATKGERFTL
ncbi:hypothetical protein ACWDOP_02145 [Nocardia sp. NPDC003693]